MKHEKGAFKIIFDLFISGDKSHTQTTHSLIRIIIIYWDNFFFSILTFYC